jgi:S-formylglutathione hydrolase
MRSYVEKELLSVLAELPLDLSSVGISGHSMGGHGAITIGLRRPDLFKSISAFAPICNPSAVPWGRKAFAGYLGEGQHAWEEYDAVRIVKALRADAERRHILIDQGTADKFLETQLRPETLVAAAEGSSVTVDLRLRNGYDHSYLFIATWIEEHLEHHAAALCGLMKA